MKAWTPPPPLSSSDKLCLLVLALYKANTESTCLSLSICWVHFMLVLIQLSIRMDLANIVDVFKVCLSYCWFPQMIYHILFVECCASVFTLHEFHLSLHCGGILPCSHSSCVLLQQKELNRTDFFIHWFRLDSSETWHFIPVLVTSVKTNTQQSCFWNVSQCWSLISNLCWMAEFNRRWISTVLAGMTI